MWSNKQAAKVGGLFVKGYLDPQLRIVHANTSTDSRAKGRDGEKDVQQEHYLSSSWMQQEKEIRKTGSQRMKRQMRSARRPDQERRMARVEELRELVQTGRYHVNSMALAQRMLDNETHFIELSPQ